MTLAGQNNIFNEFMEIKLTKDIIDQDTLSTVETYKNKFCFTSLIGSAGIAQSV